LKQVDAVITWVDGNDPIHREKRNRFLSPNKTITPDINGDTRFNSVGEIYYCIASILTFASFFRKIFIVTDQQDPKIENFKENYFPNHPTEIEIIDHQEIFEGYHQYLPVFNSIAIETMLFRIKNLSEHYVYFNDDFFLLKPVYYNDFFIENTPVSSGEFRSTWIDKAISWVKPIVQGRRKFGYKDSLINVFQFIPFNKNYWYLNHAPTPLLKSVFTQFYQENPNALIHNIEHKFRNQHQYNTQSLFYQLLILSKKEIQRSKKTTLFLRPNIKNQKYLSKKIGRIQNEPLLSFCCAESLDGYPTSLQNYFFNQLKEILGLTSLDF